MNEQGYRTTQGNEFRPAVLAGILHHPAVAGLQETQRGDLVDSGGPRIIPVEDFVAIRAMRKADDPGKQRTVQREYLMSGPLSVCGPRGTTLGTAPSNAGARGHRCPPSTAQHPGGCGKVRINADLFEQFVAEHVLAELAKPEVSALVERARDEVLAEAAGLRERVAAHREKQAQLGRDYASSQVSARAFKAADRALAEQIRQDAARARILEQVRHAPTGEIRDLMRCWKHAPLASRKGLVTLMLEQVAVYPAASRGSRTVDSDRVALHWRRWTQGAA